MLSVFYDKSYCNVLKKNKFVDNDLIFKTKFHRLFFYGEKTANGISNDKLNLFHNIRGFGVDFRNFKYDDIITNIRTLEIEPLEHEIEGDENSLFSLLGADIEDVLFPNKLSVDKFRVFLDRIDNFGGLNTEIHDAFSFDDTSFSKMLEDPERVMVDDPNLYYSELEDYNPLIHYSRDSGNLGFIKFSERLYALLKNNSYIKNSDEYVSLKLFTKDSFLSNKLTFTKPKPLNKNKINDNFFKKGHKY